MPTGPTTTRRSVNGVELDLIEAGDPAGPAIVLSHGFPESSHSWRHQIEPLAAAGYHVLAPDQRGYGRSSAPRDVEAYGVDHLAGDLVALLDITGHDDAVFVGHDWGALLVWDLARLHPDRVRAVINVSVPYTEWPAPPTDVFRAASGDRFFYILYFQPVGPAEAELDADVERTMRTVLWAASGEGFPETPVAPLPAEGHGFLDSMSQRGPAPAELPAWLTEADLATYIDSFEASGFFGPVSWYRNLDANHARVKDLPPPSMPTWFIGGTKDMVIAARPGYVESMAKRLPDLRGTVLIEGAGHWTQQEAPDAFNRALLGALAELDGADASASR
ncbi:MAG: alpha/beta hydrolase [Ilumatobacteraceae bacterium]